MTFHIITLGCKVNIYESEIMREKLENNGYKYSESEKADITIINTCSVTNMADKKSQKTVRHIKRDNPNTILVVAGCSAENKEDIYKEMDIDILIGNKDKSNIVSFIENFQKEKKKITKFYHTRNLPFEDMTVNRFKNHTRAFLKIQDGCNNFCSYCIIPYVRGTTRSKDFKTTLEEAKTLAENHSEIVLTGIHTGSYKTEDGHDLSDLLNELGKIEKLKRIRISSIEITELNDKFLEELKNNPKICNHLHIPLQAGSNEILKKMNRKYDLQYFKEKLQKIREIRPNISITTDIIVGHPYETEELFQETLKNAREFAFSKIHAFPYSKREGTVAASMPDQVEENVKKERNRALIELSKELEEEYAKQFLNQSLDVLIEESGNQYSIGHTQNYLKVMIDGPQTSNELYEVRITSWENNYLKGELISSTKHKESKKEERKWQN